jgi:hypothetical protein
VGYPGGGSEVQSREVRAMSRFYASIQGSRGMATRQGSEESGIEGHIRGWNLGVEVFFQVDGRGEDTCIVYLTGGSYRSANAKFLGRFSRKDLEK